MNFFWSSMFVNVCLLVWFLWFLSSLFFYCCILSRVASLLKRGPKKLFEADIPCFSFPHKQSHIHTHKLHTPPTHKLHRHTYKRKWKWLKSGKLGLFLPTWWLNGIWYLSIYRQFTIYLYTVCYLSKQILYILFALIIYPYLKEAGEISPTACFSW